jgi:hypothetical protein
MNLIDRLEKENWETHLKEIDEEMELDNMVWEEHLKEVEEDLILEEDLCK